MVGCAERMDLECISELYASLAAMDTWVDANKVDACCRRHQGQSSCMSSSPKRLSYPKAASIGVLNK